MDRFIEQLEISARQLATIKEGRLLGQAAEVCKWAKGVRAAMSPNDPVAHSQSKAYDEIFEPDAKSLESELRELAIESGGRLKRIALLLNQLDGNTGR